MFRKKRLKKYRLSNTFFLVMAMVIFAMGIGYAAISTTLEIDGTSDIDSASWDVHFANVQVTTGSVAATTPAISNNTSVSFSANLANPGDFYEFTVDVVNEGTLDAKLDGIEILPVLTQAQQNYFKYTVTYSDGIDIINNDSLDAGETETLLIRFEYLTQTDTSLYPTDDTNFDFSVSMTYIQGHGNAIREEIFNISSTVFTIGQAVPTGVTTYNNYQSAINAFGNPFVLKHIISREKIDQTYVGFVVDNNIYYLRGAGATYNTSNNSYNDDSPYFNSNKLAIQTALGDTTCYDYGTYYECQDLNRELRVSASAKGIVAAGNIHNNRISCYINGNGTANCYAE